MMIMMQGMKMFMIKTLHCDKAPIESCIKNSLAFTGNEMGITSLVSFRVQFTSVFSGVRTALFTCGA